MSVLTRTVIALVLSGAAFACRPSAESALSEFRTADVPECAISRPLVLAGRDVVPLVLEEIKDSSMPKRRYAISALGDIGDTRAIEPLKAILLDLEERDYYRADALEAIHKIDRGLGGQLAARYIEEDGLLGRLASEISQGQGSKRYGFWSALVSSKCR